VPARIFRRPKMEVATDTRQLFELLQPTEIDNGDVADGHDTVLTSDQLNVDNSLRYFHNYFQ
jgi:hypothetical protein